MSQKFSFFHFFDILFLGGKGILCLLFMIFLGSNIALSGTKSINFTEINLGLVFDGVNTGNGAYLMIKEVNDA